MIRSFIVPLRVRRQATLHLSWDVNPFFLNSLHPQTAISQLGAPSSTATSQIHPRTAFLGFYSLAFQTLLSPFYWSNLHPQTIISDLASPASDFTVRRHPKTVILENTVRYFQSLLNPVYHVGFHPQTILAFTSAPSSSRVSDRHLSTLSIIDSQLHVSTLMNPIYLLTRHPSTILSHVPRLEHSRVSDRHLKTAVAEITTLHPSSIIASDFETAIRFHPSTLISESTIFTSLHPQTLIEPFTYYSTHISTALEVFVMTDTGCNPLIVEVSTSLTPSTVVCGDEASRIQVPVSFAINSDTTWMSYVTEIRVSQRQSTLYDECEVSLVVPPDKAEELSRITGFSASNLMEVHVGGSRFVFALEEVSRLRSDLKFAEIQLWGRSSQVYELEQDWPQLSWTSQFVPFEEIIRRTTSLNAAFDRKDIGGGPNVAVESSYLFETRRGVKIADKLMDLTRESGLKVRAPADRPGWVVFEWEFLVHPLLTNSIPPRASFIPRWIRESVEINTYDAECDSIRVYSAEQVPAKLELCPTDTLCKGGTPSYLLVFRGFDEDYALGTNIPGLSLVFERSESLTRSEFFTTTRRFATFTTQYPFISIVSYSALSGSIESFMAQPSSGEIYVSLDSDTGGIIQVDYVTIVDWYKVYPPHDFPPGSITECTGQIFLNLTDSSVFHELSFDLFDRWCDEVRLNARFTEDFIKNVAFCHLYRNAFVRMLLRFSTPYCDGVEVGQISSVFSPLDGRLRNGYLRVRDITVSIRENVREVWQDLELESFVFSSS